MQISCLFYGLVDTEIGRMYFRVLQLIIHSQGAQHNRNAIKGLLLGGSTQEANRLCSTEGPP